MGPPLQTEGTRRDEQGNSAAATFSVEVLALPVNAVARALRPAHVNQIGFTLDI
ncbi:hypothetical protein JQ570_28055 [Bradyrhizobium liaoningense]|nr:hypothetical protein [Bradyrhizobium liaoningense]